MMNLDAFRNLPSMDMTNPENIKSAAEADSPSSVSGKYVVKIVQASLEQAKNGSIFVTLAFEMPNGKVYRQDAMQFRTAPTAENPNGMDGFYAAKMRTIFGVTRAKDTIGTSTIMSGEFVDNSWVQREVEVPSYVDLIGKKIGAVLYFYQKYPDSFGINGYTGRPIPSRQSDPYAYEQMKNEATTIWMPNYDKEPKPVFDFKLFYNPENERTFSEMTDDNIVEPIAVADELSKVMKKDRFAVKLLDPKKWDEKRIELLKKNLKKINQQFDRNLFEPSSEYGAEPAQDNSNLI
jgi:hypothetical protein